MTRRGLFAGVAGSLVILAARLLMKGERIAKLLSQFRSGGRPTGRQATGLSP